MKQLKAVTVVLLLVFIIIFIYDLLFSDSGGYVVYQGDVVGFFPLNVNKETLNNLEIVKHRGARYSYMLLKNQEDLGKILQVPYKKTDFNKYNLLAIKVYRGKRRLVGSRVYYYGTYKVKWKFNRLYIELFPKKRGGSYNCFGIEIPKEDTRIIEYIEKGNKVYIVTP